MNGRGGSGLVWFVVAAVAAIAVVGLAVIVGAVVWLRGKGSTRPAASATTTAPALVTPPASSPPLFADLPPALRGDLEARGPRPCGAGGDVSRTLLMGPWPHLALERVSPLGGRLMIAGRIGKIGTKAEEPIVVLASDSGHVAWSARVLANAADAVLTPSGPVIAIAERKQAPLAAIVALDAGGHERWRLALSDDDEDGPETGPIVATDDGGVICQVVFGGALRTPETTLVRQADDEGVVLLKVDSAGKVAWTAKLPDLASGIAASAAGAVALGTNTSKAGEEGLVRAVTIGAGGKTTSTAQITASGDPGAVATSSGERFFLWHRGGAKAHRGTDPSTVLELVDADGRPRWQDAWSSNSGLADATVLQDGSVVVMGYGDRKTVGKASAARAPVAHDDGTFVASLDPDGRPRWVVSVGGAPGGIASDGNTITMPGSYSGLWDGASPELFRDGGDSDMGYVVTLCP